jgi:hypothetical protein
MIMHQMRHHRQDNHATNHAKHAKNKQVKSMLEGIAMPSKSSRLSDAAMHMV